MKKTRNHFFIAVLKSHIKQAIDLIWLVDILALHFLLKNVVSRHMQLAQIKLKSVIVEKFIMTLQVKINNDTDRLIS